MNLPYLIRRSSAAILALLLSGCAHLPSGSVQPTALPTGQMLSRHVVLVQDPKLADYKYEFHRVDDWVFPLGAPFQNYAQQVAKQTFQQVDVVPSIEKAEAQTSADLILIPRPVKCNASFPVSLAKDVNMTFVVEWAAEDRASKNKIWLKTITANAAEPMGGFAQGKHQQILIQKLFDDLSLKTYSALQNASELK